MELFIKRFIDLLDEMVPVTMVHTLTEQPLGALIHDYYIRIHARLDLADEDSPFVEIELYPYSYNHIEAVYAYTYPNKGMTISESEFTEKIKARVKVQAEKITPLDEEEPDYFELFYQENMDIPKDNRDIDQLIHEIVPKVKDWLSIGGYELADED